MEFDEKPEAGDEWIAKAMLIGAVLEIEPNHWGVLWAARMPGNPRIFYGVTRARACRKLIRTITGAYDEPY